MKKKLILDIPEWNIEGKQYTLEDICDARTPDELNEASLGRVYQHYQNSKEKSFAILTSNRAVGITLDKHSADLARQKNNERFRELKGSLKSSYGYFDLIGHGQEDLADGTVASVEEPSLFVIGITLNDAMQIAKKFQQYGFLYAGPETKGNVWLYTTSGGHEDTGPFHPMRISKFYSIIQGKRKMRTFTFESLPKGWIEGQYVHLHGMSEISGINRRKVIN